MLSAKFPARFDHLRAISVFVMDAIKESPFDERQRYAIDLAVDEACSNVIDHAYGGEDRGEIRILLDLNDKGLKITIQDDGTPFEPEDVAEPDLISPLETRCERGLGVFLIRKIMDEARWDFSIPGVNQLTLVKYFTANQNPQTHD
ncbi:MAG: ATP-binding protein [Anaerolineaceae bacterium]|jgi:serine/threonine-protein kinase RsbW|nr:ATP-binding protein [Anaerolineaceae bacterium]MDI9530909.1 ATP-binding protein [Chloroflexota bacterium]